MSKPKPNTKLPDGVTLEQLKTNYDIARRQYRKAFKRARILDATDSGYMWEAIKAKFPKYQILPDTNHVSYVKNNLLANIYTVGKSATIAATSEEDKEIEGNNLEYLRRLGIREIVREVINSRKELDSWLKFSPIIDIYKFT